VKQLDINFSEFLKKAKGLSFTKEDLAKIRKAYDFANSKHNGQKRLSGEDYIIHPLQVANILLDLYPDCDTIIAGLLHDLIEDTKVTKDEIGKDYGKDVANLVDGVTKISKLNYATHSEYIVENTKKIIIGMSEDVRVMIVKLADRLHNMRTLEFLPANKQKENAKETLEIFAPLAHRLGLQAVKGELEDLGLKYYKPEVFFDIVKKLDRRKSERDLVVNKMMEDIIEILKAEKLDFKIKGRTKSIYSIYKKLETGKSFNDIWDFNGLRIFVNKIPECYLVMGLIHSKYKPVPGRIKDFIANPKTNMYQSLHTTVFGIDKQPFEIQIRTYEMDDIAENGIAAHFLYKENKNESALKDYSEQKIRIFKSILDLKNSKISSEEFVDTLKGDILKQSPAGDVVELPEGSTPIDFAYKVHTEIGDKAIGALIDDRIVPLSYKLRSGQVLNIKTQNDSKPKKEWLNFVHTSLAKSRIKNFFVKENKVFVSNDGLVNLKEVLKKYGLVLNESLKTIQEKIDSVEHLCYDDFLYQCGLKKDYGDEVVRRIFNIVSVSSKPNKSLTTKTIINNDSDILVDGIDNIKTVLAGCCMPIFGDEVVGIITRKNGITVHRKNCKNMDFSKAIEVSWIEKKNKNYSAKIVIVSEGNNLSKIINAFEAIGISLKSMSLNKKDGYVYEMIILLRNTKVLKDIFKGIKKIKGVKDIYRK